MTPTLRQLEYLVALSDELSFRRAAEACHVSQPALSTQIQQLESVLDVQLFERDRRRVVATPAGVALAARAREVLVGVKELVAGARTFGEPLTGPVRLGVIPTIAPYLLPAALPRVQAKFPDMRLLIHEAPTEALLALLERGELDLLLLAREADLGEVVLLDLFRDPFLLAVPSGHRLARRRRLRAGDLQGEAPILLEDGH